jgi:hypothetical protein
MLMLLVATLALGPMVAYYVLSLVRGKKTFNPHAPNAMYKVDDPFEFLEPSHKRGDGFDMIDKERAIDDFHDQQRIWELEAAKRSDPALLAWDEALATGRDIELERLLAAGSWRLARSLAQAREQAALARGKADLAALYRGYLDGIGGGKVNPPVPL